MVAIQYSWLNRLRAYFQHRSRADEVQNPAYQAGIPGNGQPFPDGAEWRKSTRSHIDFTQFSGHGNCVTQRLVC